MRVDNVALLPAYLAAGTALLALVVDLIAPARRAPVQVITALGAVATAVAAIWVGTGGGRSTFCVPGAGCSYVANSASATIATVFAVITLVVVLLSGPVLRTGVPAGEYHFLLAASMTGGAVVGASGDLITLIIAVETITLPLYILVGLRRRAVASAEAAMTFFLVSVVSTAVTLLGVAMLYATTGAVHFGPLAAKLADPAVRGTPLAFTGIVLVLVGLAFKVAAVPLHAWAPATYDGAPVPVAAYLSTASKLGGIVAIWYVTVKAFGPALSIAGPLIAALAVATMTVGNLAALRQHRMVRLLAWSSIAQAGYIIAPLGAFAVAGGRGSGAVTAAVAATVGYFLFYILLELGAFGSVVALRGGEDGGEIAWYRGTARRSPWIATAFAIALTGLAGLPPGFAGLFAKAIVIRSLAGNASAWLAVVVALNAVVGLAYYMRVVATLFAAPPEAPAQPVAPVPAPQEAVLVGAAVGGAAAPAATDLPAGTAATPAPAPDAGGAPEPVTGAGPAPLHWPVAAILSAVTLGGLVVGFAPQLIQGLTEAIARLH